MPYNSGSLFGSRMKWSGNYKIRKYVLVGEAQANLGCMGGSLKSTNR